MQKKPRMDSTTEREEKRTGREPARERWRKTKKATKNRAEREE